MTQRSLSNPMTIVGLVNGMIGGIILVMPILAIKTGLALIGPVTLLFGLFSFFSCLLCLRHLRNYADLDEAVLRHFNNNRKYKVAYDIIVIVSLSVLLILYFGLICDMWEGMTEDSVLIPILNALVLFPIIYVLRKFHFGATLLAYGILSIISYVIFLTWMWAATEPGEKKVPVADSHFVKLGSALAQGFAIQAFFIPILKQNKNRPLYKKLLIVTYIIGVFVYCYIGYSGSQSIVNMVNRTSKKQAQQIGDFFGDKQWQVILVEIIYLVHLYTAFPQFLLIAKKRFFSIFGESQTPDVTYKEVIYVGVTIFVCLVIRTTSISPEILIQLNGSIVSFFLIIVIPVTLHLKCVYFTKPEDRIHKIQSPRKTTEKSIDQDHQQQIEMQKKQSKQSKQPMQSSQIIRTQQYVKKYDPKEEDIHSQIPQSTDKQTTNSESQLKSLQKVQYSCCDIKFRSKAHEVAQGILITLMVLTGLFTMGYTIFLLIVGVQQVQ